MTSGAPPPPPPPSCKVTYWGSVAIALPEPQIMSLKVLAVKAAFRHLAVPQSNLTLL